MGIGIGAAIAVACGSEAQPRATGVASAGSASTAAGRSGVGVAGTTSDQSGGVSGRGLVNGGGANDGAGNGGAGVDDSAGQSGSSVIGGNSGSGGEGGAAAQLALVKFCNDVSGGTEQNPTDITLRVDIGTAPNLVSISAKTGTCTPVAPASCTAFEPGTEIPVKLIDPVTDPKGNAPLSQSTIDANPGDAWVLAASAGVIAPTLASSYVLGDSTTCSGVVFSDVF